MKTKEEIASTLSSISLDLWRLRGDILQLGTAATTVLAELVGDASDIADNCCELLKEMK